MSAPTDLPLPTDTAAPTLRGAAAAPIAAAEIVPAASPRKRLWLVLRIAIPLALLAFLLSRVSLSELLSGLRAVSLTTIAGVAGLLTFNLFLAGVRWRVTMLACGVRRTAPILELFRLHWIGAFYTACVPGGVGGEVVRAIATRNLFGERGFTGALGVALLERLLGVCGLLVLVTTAFALRPLPGVPNVALWGALGVLAVIGCVGAVLIAPRLAPYLPGPLQRVVQAVPVIESLPLFGVGVLMSVATQLFGCLAGHLVVADIAPSVTLAQSLVIMPLIFASAYFPLTVGGAGVRELAFVSLYGLVGVAQHDALAASFVVMAMQFVSGASGGIVQMLRPLEVSVRESLKP